MLTLNLETFKLFQGSLPLHWLHIWSLCSNLWLCFVDSLSFNIFSFILLNIVYWALFGDHDLWWSSIFPKPRSSQILDLLADGKWLLPIEMWLPKIPSLLMFWHQIWSPDCQRLWKPLLNIEPTTFQDLKEAPGVPPTKRSSLCRIYSDFISEINSDQSKVNRPNQSRKKSLLF